MPHLVPREEESEEERVGKEPPPSPQPTEGGILRNKNLRNLGGGGGEGPPEGAARSHPQKTARSVCPDKVSPVAPSEDGQERLS